MALTTQQIAHHLLASVPLLTRGRCLSANATILYDDETVPLQNLILRAGAGWMLLVVIEGRVSSVHQSPALAPLVPLIRGRVHDLTVYDTPAALTALLPHPGFFKRLWDRTGGGAMHTIHTGPHPPLFDDLRPRTSRTSSPRIGARRLENGP